MISIITAVFNSAETVADALDSIAIQSHAGVEQWVIDGLSTDGTDAIVDRYQGDSVSLVREKDAGIYDALNKGIRHSSGDIVGFLHADDMLASHDCLAAIADAFLDPKIDAVFGDLMYVDAADTDKIVRYWKDRTFDRGRFRYGWMPAHPTFYIRRRFYEEFGGFREDLRSSADYECMLRLLYKHQLRAKYIPKVLVKMRVGGQSNASIANRRLANWEDRQAWIVNGLKPPPMLRITKPLRKLPQYWRRPNR